MDPTRLNAEVQALHKEIQEEKFVFQKEVASLQAQFNKVTQEHQQNIKALEERVQKLSGASAPVTQPAAAAAAVKQAVPPAATTPQKTREEIAEVGKKIAWFKDANQVAIYDLKARTCGNATGLAIACLNPSKCPKDKDSAFSSFQEEFLQLFHNGMNKLGHVDQTAFKEKLIKGPVLVVHIQTEGRYNPDVWKGFPQNFSGCSTNGDVIGVYINTIPLEAPPIKSIPGSGFDTFNPQKMKPLSHYIEAHSGKIKPEDVQSLFDALKKHYS